MIPQVVVHPQLDQRISYFLKVLGDQQVNREHADVMWMEEEKLGVEQAKSIRNHLSLKPFQADKKFLVLEHAGNLTADAQNALLKTLEEPEGEAVLLLGVASEDQLLPTILSRCQVIRLQGTSSSPDEKLLKHIPDLLKMGIEERFQFVEKIDDRVAFHQALVYYFQQKLPENLEFTQELLESEQWLEHNVTPRAVLEYLMLKLPSFD